MTTTLTFTGDWADIRREMRSVLGDPLVGIPPENVQITFNAEGGEGPAPRTRRKKAETPVADEPQVVEPEAPEPVYESTVTTPLVEEPVPSVDAPVETQASTSEAGSDAPASGTATPASDVTYADVVKAVTDLAKAKGGAAVKAALGEMGLTTAKDTAPDVWPAIIDAMREAM